MKSASRVLVGLAALWLVAGSASAQIYYQAVEPENPETASAQSVSYVTGGIGSGERQAMTAAYGTWPVKFEFALDVGSYLTPDTVVIYRDKDKILEVSSLDGPWLYVDLTSGKYTGYAVYEGETRKFSLEVGKKGQRRVVLMWKGYAPRGDRNEGGE
ncbi:MAG: hypothetical protein HQK57_15270 [Deltaproteobacteria bacterium]|nr:hypothetical protein [Deltaproteobacteria bacterium]MBF0524456.1 hypothetical protein [Deltaproteobacteria bacterium]